MGIGPQLPSQPDSVKRKRDTTECDENVASLAEIAHATAPSLHEKRQRVFGPALPPAPLDQRPEADTEVPSWGGSDDGDEDDDFGPSLPGAADAAADHASTSTWNDSSEGQAQSTAVKPKREDWMLAPPPGDDWTSRIDPTKLKSRKFNSGRGAAAQSSRNPNDSSSWTETPEEKKRRLENEVMGVSAPTHADKPSKMTAREESEAKATDRKIREYNVSQRTLTALTRP